jgi:hypothetical protein
MIQFYINSRPVPRAIARHHLSQSVMRWDSKALGEMLSRAARDDKEAIYWLSGHGVSVAQVRA